MTRFPKFLLGGLLAFGALTAAPAQAQTVVINPPSWGPAAPAGTRYYYLPEVDGYYDLRSQEYIVRRDGQWQRQGQLNGFDRNSWRPRVIDYLGDTPWSRYDEDRRRYPAGLPPGQRKRLENGKGLPPGQAKKYGNQGYGNRDRDDRRYDNNDRRRDDDRRDEERRRDDTRRAEERRRDDGRRAEERRRYEDRSRDRRDDNHDRDDDRDKKDKGYKDKEYNGKGKGKD